MELMERIEQGIKKKHSPTESDTDFVDAVYELFDEFKDSYTEEWTRIDDNEKMYRGDHWHDVPQSDPNEPRPSTPIIQSTIENIRADLGDEFPEAVIRPEDIGDEVCAKVLTEIVAQDLEATDYEHEYDLLSHDILVGGWTVQETGWDNTLHNGLGGSFIRHVSNKNFMCDPKCADIQNGRAVFKFDKLPREFFRQRFPKVYPHMENDVQTISKEHDEFGNLVKSKDSEYMVMIEAWFRFFDGKRYRVHMVKVAGGKVLENSYNVKADGYFAHGEYPFKVTPLFTQKGTPFGYGIVDMFKSAQKYSDKLDQILLTNALIASKPKLLVQADAADIDDLRDYSKSVHEVKGNPDLVAKWHNPPPLPSHIMNYMALTRQSIKDESGSNDFSRGNVSAGVTAASAITALQEMSSKRSRMESRRLHLGFKESVRMMLEVDREFITYPRFVTVTIAGEPQRIKVSDQFFRANTFGIEVPIEFNVSIKTMRETKFTKLANNELMLQAVNIFGQSADPVIIFEGMEFDGKELLLEKLRAAQGKGMLALQQQLQQAQQIIEQLSQQNQEYGAAVSSMQNALAAESEPTDQPTLPEQLSAV